ncbi:hypothetical protein HMPREF0290_1011 [Corynebacterium efficiens YS-314]|uniref:hypothetical protein n=1 Tax=Corynebacterium efficiens TaxID=152794 RepID=UPI0001B86F53|nr:hypothetical protein [Corynebacterium efficiens]EEW50341.1 hypothetical protein HMPREF0290_1011 [Corynebacterium efficiens YS-314]
MEPMDINGGRFYARKLTADERINDLPALATALGHPVDGEAVARSYRDWAEDTVYTWAICEQTSVEMLALARLRRGDDDTADLEVLPVGDPATSVPNDPMLTPVTISDAVEQGGATIRRWARGFLGITV